MTRQQTSSLLNERSVCVGNKYSQTQKLSIVFYQFSRTLSTHSDKRLVEKKVLSKARDDAMMVSDPRSDLRTEWSDGEGSGGCRLLSERRGHFALDANVASAHLLLTSKHRSTPSYSG